MSSRIARFISHYNYNKENCSCLAIEMEQVVVGFSAGGLAGGGCCWR